MDITVPIPLSWLTTALQFATLTVGGWIVKTTTDIRHELRTLNGRVIRLEQWQHDHCLTDETLHREVENMRAFVMQQQQRPER